MPSNLAPTPSDASLAPGRPWPFCIQATQDATKARTRRWTARMALRHSLGLPVPNTRSSGDKKMTPTSSLAPLPLLKADVDKASSSAGATATGKGADATGTTVPPPSLGFHESELAAAAAEEQTRIDAWKMLEHRRLNGNAGGDESFTEPTSKPGGDGGSSSTVVSSSIASQGGLSNKDSGNMSGTRELCDPECVRWYSVQVLALTHICTSLCSNSEYHMSHTSSITCISLH